MKLRVIKLDKGLAVVIPQEIVNQEKLKEGDFIELKFISDREALPELSHLILGITPENRYAEISTGAEVGRESLEW